MTEHTNFEDELYQQNQENDDIWNIFNQVKKENKNSLNNFNLKNNNTKEYILKKNTGRDVKMKIIKLNNFKQTSKEEYKNSEKSSENENKLNVKLTDNCLRNFIYNALENEWKLKKIDNKYFCSKRHKGDKRVYEAGYLKEFLLDSFTF